MTAASIAPRAPQPWFRSASFDWLFLLGVPVLTWPLVMAGQTAFGPDLLAKLILLTATGHYFATFVRTYGDRELFRRFSLRFLLAPPLLLLLCLSMFAAGHGPALLLVTAGWAFWHWLAQAFGLARIYDVKRGSYRPLTAWLDKALVITGFTGALTLTDGAVAEFGKNVLNAGMPLPTAAQFAVAQHVVLAAMVVVAAAYLANLAATIACGQPWSWQKQVMHVTTIGYYWFAFAWLPNVLVAYVLYELFHDIQYYAIVWLTCRGRVQRAGVTPWFARMFRPGFLAAAGFVLAMTAFGAIDVAGRGLESGSSLQQLSLAVFLTAALLHYYYDGFIWKVRESSLGEDLGIRGGLRAAVVPGLRHAALWALFAVPLVLLVALGREPPDRRERAAALVALAPGDFASQAELGLELLRSRELEASLSHYRASIAANPDFAQSRVNFGAALDFAGDLDGAEEQYRAALRCRDSGGAHRTAHTNLGVLLLQRGQRAAAQEHLQQGHRLGGEPPVGRLLGLAAALPAEAVERRIRCYEAALELEPEQHEARLQLGNLRLARRDWQAAAVHFGVLAQRAPGFVPGLLGLATARLQLGQRDSARELVQRVLQQEPGNARAQELLRQLGGG